ncbi:muscle-specific protein 300 kDa-like [Bacillus rossius redtenbacheri]|uniref:muscle-specific protein 300 kDa-like n=1 Tax=Bacillus rossius redtenbacheri TaxID=93214 RepID=UPI002FDCD300
MERHDEVKQRLASWDGYRADQVRLLAWLKDMEQEKSRLQLRYVHVRRVPRILDRIQTLLDRVPSGENQVERLQAQQASLLQFSDDALATSIRMEHASIRQRVGNLRAGLETWKDFLERVASLARTYEEQVARIQGTFHSVHAAISDPAGLPSMLEGMRERLATYQELRTRLRELTPDLEEAGVVQEQLKECVSPADMKTISQKVWLLWQTQGDLEHQLCLLCLQLEERLGLGAVFHSRQARFLQWAGDVEARLEAGSGGDPEELLRRLETELRTELGLKRREVDWLLQVGADLVDACPQGSPQRQDAQAKLLQVESAWARVQSLGEVRASRLQQVLQTKSQLELQLAELRAWLHQMESRLIVPLVFEQCTKESVEKLLRNHEELQQCIENHSSTVAEVLNGCELFLTDCENCKATVNTEAISTACQALESRWKKVCSLSAERKRRILAVFSLLQELMRLCKEQQQWLDQVEKNTDQLGSVQKFSSQAEVQDLLSRVEAVVKDVAAHAPGLEILDRSYSKLAQESGLDRDNVQLLTGLVRATLQRWHALPVTAAALQQALCRHLQLWRDFVATHGRAVVALAHVDGRLTHIQHLSSPEQAVLPRLQELEAELSSHEQLLHKADDLGEALLKKTSSGNEGGTRKMMEEYRLLWQDITARIAQLKELSAEEAQQVQEVDESVQVETLRFEQDSAVQVDTLPRQPTQLTSRDAYLFELEVALSECLVNLDALQLILTLPLADDEPATAGQLSKTVASCESSVELVRHLSALLVAECGVSEEQARAREVQELSDRFQALRAQAREREQQLRDIRSSFTEAYYLICEHESARLTCPLCSRRNWDQLENDLWRLEQWLQFAEGTQSEQRVPPANIEQLEDIIQDHREFLLDLDSHKSLVVSLNIVGNHLANHTEDAERAGQLRSRLVGTNARWDAVCRAAAIWQTKLQTALMENHEFHRTIEELVEWLEQMEKTIRATEPVDLAADILVIEAKYNRLRELRGDLQRCEPRVMSLQEAADQLLRHSDAPGGSLTTWARLAELRLRLQSLRRITGQYVLKLGAVLGRDPSEPGSAATSLASLSRELLDQAAASHGDGASHSDQQHSNDEVDTAVLTRGYRFLGRVLRASLPIQALMLLLLGVASLVPAVDDLACNLRNNYAQGFFEPMLRYPNGPPPI